MTHAFAVIAGDLAVVLMLGCIAAGLVEAVGKSRLAAWLRLPSIEDDER